MNQEQRLILAFSITLAILMAWTLLVPPVPQDTQKHPPHTPNHNQVWIEPVEKDSVKDLRIGNIVLGLGESTGSIHRIQTDGVLLWEDERYHFLDIQLKKPSGAIPWQWMEQDGTLIGQAEWEEEGLYIFRTLSQEKGSSPFSLKGEIGLVNRNTVPKEIKARYLVYRPLHPDHPHGRNFLYGMVRTEKGEYKIRPKRGLSQRFDHPIWITSQKRSHALIVQPVDGECLFHVEHPLDSDHESGWIEIDKVLKPKEKATWSFRIYAGPMEMSVLQRLGLEEAVSYGAFSSISVLLLKFLHLSRKWLPNYGLAICALSLAIWIPFSPITWYGMQLSRKTSEKMAVIKPKEERIRKEFRNNPRKMQEELLHLYRQHGINPAAGCLGCLPLLVTMPVYIALFQVLNRAPELRGSNFLWIDDLSAPDRFFRFPFTIPMIGDHLNLLPILATAAMFLQQRLAPAYGTALTEEQKIQQKIFRFFPVFLLVILYNSPAGFMLYWTVNSVLMLGQQLILTKKGRPIPAK